MSAPHEQPTNQYIVTFESLVTPGATMKLCVETYGIAGLIIKSEELEKLHNSRLIMVELLK